MDTLNTRYRLVEYDDRWVIPLQGKTVTRCFFDSAFGMEFWERDCDITLRIEGNFLFQEHGRTYKLSPDHPSALGPVLSVWQKVVDRSIASKDGSLSVVFMDSSSLSVSADADYEAWEIVGSVGLRIVCGPGGRLSIWQPT